MSGSNVAGSIATKFFEKWKIGFTIILAVIVSISGFVQFIDTGDPKPLFTEIGGRVLRSDGTIAEISQNIIANEGFSINYESSKIPFFNFMKKSWAFIKTYFPLIASVWFMIVMLMFWMWVFSKTLLSNNSNDGINFVLAVILIGILQMGFVAYSYGADDRPIVEKGTMAELLKNNIPYRGLFYDFPRSFKYMFSPVYGVAGLTNSLPEVGDPEIVESNYPILEV